MDESLKEFELIIEKYWSDDFGCVVDLEMWDSADLVALEIYVNAELQRRTEDYDRQCYPGIFDQTH